MEEIEDIEMEYCDDGGDAVDNNEQSQKVNLAEMPVEILEHILVHLDDESLLRASHVCTLFASVAETAFAQKYANEYYKVIRSDNMSFHEVMLSKYGDKIRKLEFNVNEKDEQLLDLAERTCCNLNSLDLYRSPKMIFSTGLKEVRLTKFNNLNRASFTKFINNNQHLEILELEDDRGELLEVLDGLNTLKTLKYWNHFNFANDLPTISLIALETLELDLLDTDDCVCILRAITCNELKSLSIFDNLDLDLDDIAIDQIRTFRTLTSLKLEWATVTEDQLKTLGRRLPHITEFSMNEMENIDHTIQLAMRIFPKLTKLAITLDAINYDDLSDDLKIPIQEFHARFGVTNTEIELNYEDGVMSTSKDRAFAIHWGIKTFELLWMENLNDNDLRKVLEKNEPQVDNVKIINECADATLDVSKCLHGIFDSITVHIKSKGPITVNANASRLPSFFPRLKELKVQLENASVVDLLEKLDKKFCQRIKELSIDIKNVQNDDDQKLEHGKDITHILAKFENLKSLHVATPAINIDTKDLLSMRSIWNDLRVGAPQQ